MPTEEPLPVRNCEQSELAFTSLPVNVTLTTSEKIHVSIETRFKGDGFLINRWLTLWVACALSLFFSSQRVAAQPQAFTQPAFLVTSSNAVLQAMVNPNSTDTTTWFEWGSSTNYGNQTTAVGVGSGAQVVWVTNQITGLVSGAIYHFRVAASNASGVRFGADQVFGFGQKVWAWGFGDDGQIAVPPNLTNVISVAAGMYFSAALRSDGTVVEWGRYGDTNVPPSLTNVVQIATGDAHSLALRNDGSVRAWSSYNTFGEVTIPAGLSNVIAIAAGGDHSLALKRDGTVVAWGENDYGQTNVPAGLSNVVAISAGLLHSMALKSDGTAVVWGLYFLTNSLDGITGITGIAAGGYDCVALKSNKSVFVGGDNSKGQQNVPSSLKDVITVKAGLWTVAALTSGGTLAVWGQNNYGQTNVPVGLTNAVTMSPGGEHVVALGNNGAPVATPQVVGGFINLDTVIALSGSDPNGDSVSFQINSLPTNGALYQCVAGTRGAPILTNGTAVTDPQNRVVFVPALDGSGAPYTKFQFVATDGDLLSVPADVAINLSPLGPSTFTQPVFQLTSTNAIVQAMVTPNSFPALTWFEWGTNTSYGNQTPATPVDRGGQVVWLTNQINPIIAGTIFHYRSVVSNSTGVYFGGDHVFGTGGRIWAWGDNRFGQTNLSAGLTNVVGLAAGGAFGLALRSDGKVSAWGYNGSGAINPPASLTNIVQIAATSGSGLALRNDGTVVAWGDNNFGKTNVPTGLNNVVSIACGPDYNLALRSNGTVVAWGFNYNGETNVPAGLNNVVAVAAGQSIVALKSDHTLVGWGNNGGYFMTNPPPDTSRFIDMSAGVSFAIAIQNDSTVLPWGLGLWGTTNVPPGLSNVVAISCGYDFTTALKTDGSLVVWGTNNFGQLILPSALTKVFALGTGSSATFGLVLGNNVAPVANPQTVSGFANYDVTITLTGSDVNNDLLSFKVSTLPVAGTLYQYVGGGRGAPILTNDTPITDPGRKVVFVPAADSYATSYASFQFVVSDGDLLSPPADVTINIFPMTAKSFTEPLFLLSPSNAVLQAMVTGYSFPVTAWFEWGTTASYGNQTSPVNFDRGSNVNWFTNQIDGLTNSIVYHYRIVASNNVGVSVGTDQTFSPGRKVVGWGDNTYGQVNIPTAASNVVFVAAGMNHSLALQSGGSVVGWGLNSSGQTTVPVGLSNVMMIAAGNTHSVALKNDGTCVAWGKGQAQTNVPVGLSNVVSIASGSDHVLALKNDGTVTVWGNAVTIPSGLSNVVAIAAGGSTDFALRSDGSIVGFNNNAYGQATLPAGLSNVVAIATGGYHTLALKSNGSISAWGNNTYGETNIPSGLSNITAIAAGLYHSVVVRSDGSVKAWGYNVNGQTNVPAGLSNVVAAVGGGNHTLVLGTFGGPPVAITQPATAVTTNAATLNGTVFANFLPTQVWIDWGIDTNYGASIARLPSNLTNFVPVSATVTALQPAMTYHYRVRAVGEAASAYGNDAVFTIPVPPFTISPAMSATGDLITLSFTGPTNATYTVFAATNLPGTWVPIGSATSVSPGTFQFVDPVGTNSTTRFYRVQWP
jgi:alpha-tubulin suppressor-like RCC1 family protein